MYAKNFYGGNGIVGAQVIEEDCMLSWGCSGPHVQYVVPPKTSL